MKDNSSRRHEWTKYDLRKTRKVQGVCTVRREREKLIKDIRDSGVFSNVKYCCCLRHLRREKLPLWGERREANAGTIISVRHSRALRMQLPAATEDSLVHSRRIHFVSIINREYVECAVGERHLNCSALFCAHESRNQWKPLSSLFQLSDRVSRDGRLLITLTWVSLLISLA